MEIPLYLYINKLYRHALFNISIKHISFWNLNIIVYASLRRTGSMPCKIFWSSQRAEAQRKYIVEKCLMIKWLPWVTFKLFCLFERYQTASKLQKHLDYLFILFCLVHSLGWSMSDNILLLQAIASAVQHYGAYLGPPLSMPFDTVFISWSDIRPDFTLIELHPPLA